MEFITIISAYDVLKTLWIQEQDRPGKMEAFQEKAKKGMQEFECEWETSASRFLPAWIELSKGGKCPDEECFLAEFGL